MPAREEVSVSDSLSEDDRPTLLLSQTPPDVRAARLLDVALRSGPREAYELLQVHDDALIATVLDQMNPAMADDVLWEFPEERRERVLAAAPAWAREQWVRNHEFPEDSIGRMMEPTLAVFRPDLTAHQVITRLEQIVKRAFVTYGWIVDGAGKLQGVLVFRELLFAKPDAPIGEIMVKDPFVLRADMPVTDAMKEAIKRHYPVYPVCDAEGRLLGIVRGQRLFEQQAFEISAQAGTMVGVEKEERLGTPWLRSLKLRHPWLQLNLLTAFLAATVVGTFQDTIDQLVVLAVFLPVLAGQSGNTGCQALAVVLRAITLGELDKGRASRAVLKEACLGLANGTLVGATAGLAMWVYAGTQEGAPAVTLALVVMLAMMGSCTISGVSGAVVPVMLKRLGADPATASSIFLTTATDVASMGMFLSLASWLVL
jgi:magnesium transporter